MQNIQEVFRCHVKSCLEERDTQLASNPNSFREIVEGYWENPEIVSYYEILGPDEPTDYLARVIPKLLDDEAGRILIAGGCTGRLGREIAIRYDKFVVYELDSSQIMVNSANRQASSQGLADRVTSIVGDATYIPFLDDTFDYALSHGLFRYLELFDQKEAVREMLRVSKRGISVSEGSTIPNGNITKVIYRLRYDLTDLNTEIVESEMNMPRMTLFYRLFRKYKNNPEFRLLVDTESATNGVTHVQLLRDLAGTSKGILYELRIKPF